MTPILTTTIGNNSELLPKIFDLYVEDGWTIADVTYGRGVFWKNIDKSLYTVLESDILTGTDLRDLPYDSDSIDCLILDPPYMHGSRGKPIKESINKCYKKYDDFGHEGVVRLYASGILEAARVLKKKGAIIIKTQDEIESGQQRLTHVEITQLLDLLGFKILDILVLVQTTIPAMRQQTQKTARKNHSFAIVGQFRR